MSTRDVTPGKGSGVRVMRLRVIGRAARIFVIALAATAFAQQPPPSTLRVGVSGDYAPFVSRDAAGKLDGFEIVVAEHLAHDFGMALSLVPFQWPNLVGDLQSGAFDIAMSGVTIRADRFLDVSFTRPYAVGGAVVVIRKADAKRFPKPADVNRTDARIAVNAGGHLEHVARQRFAAARLVTVADNTTLPALLREKSVDAVLSDSFEAGAWGADDFIARGPITRDRKGYAARRGAVELVRHVNGWLLAREADGWLDQQRRRFFGKSGGLSEDDANVEALVGAIDLRLQLMPYVGAVKRRDRLPIEDPEQEKRVHARVAAAAASAGLGASDVTSLFEAMISAAKTVEHAGGDPTIADALKLADLRVIIGSVGDQIIAELQRLAPRLKDKRVRRQLGDALSTDLGAIGVHKDSIESIAAAAVKVRVR